MRKLWLPAIIFALANVPIPQSPGSWGTGGCYAQPAAVAVNGPTGWFESASSPGWQCKRANGKIIEWFQPSTGKYLVLVGAGSWPLLDQRWEDRTPPADWIVRGAAKAEPKKVATGEEPGRAPTSGLHFGYGRYDRPNSAAPKVPSPAAPIGHGQKDPPPQVDVDAVMRLGSLVQHIDGTYRDGPDDVFAQAMAPPADDSGKWFISVVSMQACPACVKLKADWKTNDQLRSLAKPEPENQKESWAHFNVYDKDDKSQQWRWASIKVTGFPTVLVQPPRNGSFGDPKTVVYQGTYGGTPDKLAAAIRDAIKRYTAKLPRNLLEVAPVPREIGLAATEEIGQKKTGVDPPWKPAPKVDLPANPSIPAPNPNDQVQVPPAVEPTPINPTTWPWQTWVVAGMGAVFVFSFAPGLKAKLAAAMEKAKQQQGIRPSTPGPAVPPQGGSGTAPPAMSRPAPAPLSLAEHFAQEAQGRRRRLEDDAKTDAALRDYLMAGVRKPEDPPPLLEAPK